MADLHHASPALHSACETLRGVGPALAKKLQRLNVHTVEDLLFHLPMRYQDCTHLTPLQSLQHGAWVVVEAAVTRVHVVMGRRRALHCQISDGEGAMTMVLFHFGMSQKNQLQRVGVRLRCTGQVLQTHKGWQMVHPEYQILTEGRVLPLADRLTPVYPTTEGLSQTLLRKCMVQALQCVSQGVALTDLLPASWLKQHHLPALSEALHAVHAPMPDADVGALMRVQTPAQQRLILEELATHQLALMRVRSQMPVGEAQRHARQHDYIRPFIAQLPFALTPAQARVSEEIAADLSGAKPMMRLLQGDVGSGKTVVAALAILQVLAFGGHAGLMAPTELLAEQHYRCFVSWFSPLGLSVGYLSGQLSNHDKQAVVEGIAAGRYDLVVGTHALFQKGVNHAALDLVVIDEQHRFGVQQRLAFWKKGLRAGHCPHQLVMTATPIPRTLSMVAYAELDCSVLDVMPKGRQPIITRAMPAARRDQLLERLQSHCQDKQCYWVCTLIDASEVLTCEAAEKTFAWLKSQLPGIAMGLVHGRMKSEEKSALMNDFKNQKIMLLVATTVVEVGVDVPNATLMIIENAERLGLSQLHQLRGRVGRGAQQSHCILLYQQPLSIAARERLAIMRETQDGFVLAEKDLAMRGPGDLMGTRQTGLCQFRLANLSRDAAWVAMAQSLATAILEDHPASVEPLMLRWLDRSEPYAVV